MKIRPAFLLLLIFGILLIAGCGNKKKEEFKKDVAGLGDVMCRIMEVSNKLLASQSATPMDIQVIEELQMKKDSLESKMNELNTEFKKKYEKQMTDPEFIKDFRTEIKKTMLDCKYLSKEDRERYEKEVE